MNPNTTCYRVGFEWETQGYRCKVLSVEMRSDYERSWFSHNVEWVSKYNGDRHMKKMSYLKLKKELKRVNVDAVPETPNLFDTELFEI